MLDLSNDSNSDQRMGTSSAFLDFSSPQSTSMCMLGIESSTPAYGANKPTRLPDGSQVDSVSSRGGQGARTFQWPGIDAVMESYQLHLEGTDHCPVALTSSVFLACYVDLNAAMEYLVIQYIHYRRSNRCAVATKASTATC